MIDIDEVVQRLDRREDSKVVAYREVGLPLFRINALLTLQEAGSLGAIEEFVLRCMAKNIDTSHDIGTFLGLPGPIVTSQLGQLMFDEAIRQVESSSPRYALTKKGRTRLEDSTATRLIKEQTPIYVDGITRAVVAADPSHLWQNSQLEQAGVSAVPPAPRRPPRVSEVDLVGVNRMISLMAGAENVATRAVRLDAIIGRIQLVFRRAIALAFKSEDGKRISIAFAIDGRNADAHEIEYARSADNQKSILFGSMFNADRRRREVQAVARELRSDLPEALVNNSRGAGTRSVLSLRRDKGISSEDLVVRARALRVYEHLPLLARAFEIAKTRILIISPWIRANVVDERFIGLLAAALDRDVQVTIGYGTGRRDSAERPADRAAHDALVALTRSFKNFIFAPKGTTSARVLIVDTVFAVVTSFNWLSFKGDPNQPLKEEEGTLIEDDRSIETYFQKVKGRMQIESDS